MRQGAYSENHVPSPRGIGPGGLPEHAQHSGVRLANLFSAFVLGIALCGFYSFAPLIGLISQEGSLISIALRAVVIGSAVLALVLVQTRSTPHLILWLLPMTALLIAFSLRMYDNYFLQQLPLYIDAKTSFSFLFGAGLGPALILAKITQRLDDRSFSVVMNFLSILFIVGMVLNFDMLVETSTHRVYLDRINPIAMTSMAMTFVLYYGFFFRRNMVTRLLSLVMIPALIAIIAFSKSRGPIVSMVAAIALYVVIAKSRNRIRILQGIALLAVAGVILSYALDIDILAMALDRFSFGNESGETSVNGRQEQWAAAWQGFLDNPLLGRYIFENAYFFYPHNIILESLMSLGVVGGVLMALFIWASFRSAAYVLKDPKASSTVLFMTILFFKEFFQAMFSGSIWGVSTVWITSSVVVSSFLLLRQRAMQERSALHPTQRRVPGQVSPGSHPWAPVSNGGMRFD